MVERYTARQIAEFFGVTAGGVRKRLAEDGVQPSSVKNIGLRTRVYYGEEAIAHLDKIGWKRA